MSNAIIPSQPTDIYQPTTYPAARNPGRVYLAQLSAGSRRPMRQALDVIANTVSPGLDYNTFPWATLRAHHTQAIREKLAESYSAATANRLLSALCGVLNACWRLGYMSAEEYQEITDWKVIKREKAKRAEKKRHLTLNELTALLTVCDDGSKYGTRDAAMIMLAYTTGLRRAEIAALTLADYQPSDAGACIIVGQGKGMKACVIPLAGSACAALANWLHVRGDAPGPLFVAFRRGDHPTERGLSTQTVYDMLAKRTDEAGVKKVLPHALP